MTRSVFDLLAARGPCPGAAGDLMLYGQFVGSWDIESSWYDRAGGCSTGKGEWHFAWILGGRGVQDVLFRAGAPADHFGTTVRCYDAAIAAWHISWMQPHGGEFAAMIGRRVGDRIVQESRGPGDRRDRWTFTDIGPDSFTWLGEVSLDGGATWFLEQRMQATRRA